MLGRRSRLTSLHSQNVCWVWLARYYSSYFAADRRAIKNTLQALIPGPLVSLHFSVAHADGTVSPCGNIGFMGDKDDCVAVLM